MKRINWSTAVIVGVIVLLLLFSLGLFGGWSMMGPGMMGRWGYSSIGWMGMILGMIFMGLIPTGLIVLIVLGTIWLVQNLGSHTPPAYERNCPSCGKGVQADWQNCPYCGTVLK